ncbi:uncharacterized protein LOC126282431 [Schistocerca gregaria]|uniref:uncharacterized protein LOC126282431 n=1 Tax=Schistocerca gregaria TaxID=7010 RepID=UPI00211E21CC|nr:uncharacterized protein LOC126282431 [Schistocerca gregaria]
MLCMKWQIKTPDAGIMKEWQDAKEERREKLFDEYRARKHLLETFADAVYEMNRKSTAAMSKGSTVPSETQLTAPAENTAKSTGSRTVSWNPLNEPSPFDDATSETIEDVIEELATAELPEPILEHNWESKSDAKTRILGQISEWFELDSSDIEKLQVSTVNNYSLI